MTSQAQIKHGDYSLGAVEEADIAPVDLQFVRACIEQDMDHLEITEHCAERGLGTADPRNIER